MNDYAAVRLFIRFGPTLAAAVSLCGWAAAIWLEVMTIASPVIVVGVAIAAALVGFLLLVFTDLTKIIAEMLLPR